MSTIQELQRVAQAGKDRDPGWYRAHRRLSFPLTRLALRAGVQADHVSLAMMAAGALGVVLVAARGLAPHLAGFGVLYLSFLLDKMDGEVARCRGTASLRGVLLDRFHHRLIEPLLFVAAGVHEFRLGGGVTPLVAGFATLALANAIEENQQLPPYVLWKHVRDARGPVPAPGPAPRGIERARAWTRLLKAFRTPIVALPLLLAATVAEQAIGRPVVTAYLVLGAVALAAYLVFQCFDYASGRLESEAHTTFMALHEAAARQERNPPR